MRSLPNSFARLAVLFVGVVATAIPFHRVLLYSDRALFYRDICRDFLVQKVLWARSVAAGEGIPYWDHYTFGGMPFYAHNSEGPLHPLNAIFLFFSEPTYPIAMSFFTWAHYPLLFLGAYFLARVLGMMRGAAVALACLLALSGHSLSTNNLTHILAALVSTPYFFALWILWLRERRLRWLFAASLALAWPIYAADPQFTYILAVAAAAILGLHRSRVPGTAGLRRALFDYAALGGLTLLAAGPQLAPTLGLALESDRKLSAMGFSELLAFSFHPYRLVETLYPQFFGNRQGFEGYSGGAYVNFSGKMPFIYSTYPGALVLILFFASFPGAFRSLRAREKNTSLFLIFSVVIGFALSFGSFSVLPLYEWCARLIPLFSAFRYPERLLFWPLFAMWVVALFKLKRILVDDGKRANGQASPLFFPSLFFLGSLIFLALLATGVLGDFPVYSGKAVALGTAAFGLQLALLSLFRYRRLGRGAYLLLAGIIGILELGLLGRGLVWDQSLFIADGRRYPLVREIQADLNSRREALARGASRRFSGNELVPLEILADRINHPDLTTFSIFDNLAPNTAAFFGIEDIVGYHALIPAEKTWLWTALTRKSLGVNDASVLYNVLGAYYIPRRGPDQEMLVRRNEDALPYLFLPARVHFISTREEAAKKLVRHGFPLATDSVLTVVDAKSGAAATPEEVRAQTPARDAFLIRKRNGQAFEFDFTPVAAENAGRILIWNESYNRNWRAYVNGAPVRIYLANAWAMGIELPALPADSAAQISFRYEDPLIPLGWALGGLWILIFVGTWGARRSRKTRLA